MGAIGDATASGGRRIYWLCQLGGWAAFATIEFLFSLTAHPPEHSRWVVGAGWAIAGSDGMLATHLLYLYMHRKQWLEQSGINLLIRFVLALPAMAVVLDAIDWIVGFLMAGRSASRLAITGPLVFLTWGNWAIVLAAWASLYLALHEFRQRRVRELDGLRMKVMVQQAQLRGLRAQFNPHFLFNCLNGLREMIEENPSRAQNMVELLSGLLRYSLQPHQAELVPLADEVRAVEDYLELETIRFDERLTVHWDIAPETVTIPLPPMLLQTLVENALNHGIARRPQGGFVAIATRINGAQMSVEVTNSGSLSLNESRDGVGLRNARERLRLLYGGRAELEVANAASEQVRAVVKIPVSSQ